MDKKIFWAKFPEHTKYTDKTKKKLWIIVDKYNFGSVKRVSIPSFVDGFIFYKYFGKKIRISSLELDKHNLLTHKSLEGVDIIAIISKIFYYGEFDDEMDYFYFRLLGKNPLFPNGKFVDILVCFRAYRETYYEIFDKEYHDGDLAPKLIIIDDVFITFFY